jgi:hypothetical protein
MAAATETRTRKRIGTTVDGAADSTALAVDPGERAIGHGSCGALKRDGGVCRLQAGKGTDHVGVGRCKYHGGSTRTHRRAASVELARREIQALGLATPAPVGPAEALLTALWCAHEDLSLYRALVNELDVPAAGIHSASDSAAGIYGPTFHLTGEATGEAKRHVLVQLYEDAQKRCADIASSCLKAKVEEERVKVAQQRAETFADAMRALALALGHSPADPQVRTAMRASLQLVAGAGA